MSRVACIFCVYTKKIQVTSGMFHGIPRESIALLLYSMSISLENLRKFSRELGNLRKFPKTLEKLQNRF